LTSIKIQTALITNAAMADAVREADARHQELVDTYTKMNSYSQVRQLAIMLANNTLLNSFLD
jgi:nitrogenase subunit NifH